MSSPANPAMSETRQRMDTFTQNPPALGRLYADLSVERIWAAAEREGVRISDAGMMRVLKAKRQAYAASAMRMIEGMENPVTAHTPSGIRREVYEIRSLFASVGDKRVPPFVAKGQKLSALDRRIHAAQQAAHQHAVPAYVRLIKEANAPSYDVAFLQEKANQLMQHMVGAAGVTNIDHAKRAFQKQRKGEVEALFRAACARCFARRLNRLRTMDNMNGLDAQEMHREESALRALHSAASAGRSPKANIDKVIQKAHAKAVRRWMEKARPNEMSMEQKTSLAHRVARADGQVTPEERKWIDAALTSSVIGAKIVPYRPASESRAEDKPQAPAVDAKRATYG